MATAEAADPLLLAFPQSISFSDSVDDYTSQGEDGNIDIPDDSTNLDFPTFATLNADLASIKYDGDPNEETLLSFAMGIKVQMEYSDSESGTLGRNSRTSRTWAFPPSSRPWRTAPP